MSLIGVGRVGLRPNSDDVTNYTLFFFEVFPNYLDLNFSCKIDKGDQVRGVCTQRINVGCEYQIISY